MSWIVLMVAVSLLLPSGGLGQGPLFLSIQGTPIDADGFVDVDDIGDDFMSSNSDGLLCHTNASVRAGAWEFPNGTTLPTVTSVRVDHGGIGFGRDRGPPGVEGVVRLFQFRSPSERGRFKCDIEGSNTYVNILDIDPFSITPSNPTVTAGQPVTLQCSVDITPHPLQSTPVFEWFFGPTFNQPLTPTTNTNSGSTYTSTYSITSAMESNEGMYTCRLRGNQRTARSTMVTVEPPPTTTPPPAPMVTASITASSGTNTAGETYSLVCSVTVAGSTLQPTIAWLDDGVQIIPDSSRTVSATTGDSSNGYSSTLTFNPLSASHAGTYTCRATAGSLSDEDTFTVQVNVPDITAMVTPSSSSSLTLGQTGFSLTCDVSGTDNLNSPTLTYEWQRNGGMVPNQQEGTLSLSPLSGSQVGEYVCMVTVNSDLLNSAEMHTSETHTVSAQIPAPTSVRVTSDQANPLAVRPIGSANVTLTCTVELSPSVDISVTVNTVWTGPAEFMTTNTAQLVMGSTTTYTSTAMVSSFGRDQSGNYRCAATVSSTSQFITGNPLQSDTSRITVGVYLSLGGGGNNSNILITDIGENTGALLCYTDLTQCCRDDDSPGGMALGEWLYPNGSEVDIASGGGDFYRNRGRNIVRLNRRNNITSPVGQFCCVVPDATSTSTTVCANLVLNLPATTAPPTTSGSTSDTGTASTDSQGGGVSPGVVAGVIVIVIVLIIVVVIVAVVILVISRRRGSEKFTPPSRAAVAYSHTTNGGKVSGLGEKNGKNAIQILEFPSDTSAVEGEGVYFKIKVSGVPQPTVTWYHDGEPVKADYAREIEADGSLAIPSTELKHSGVYKAVVANQQGSEEREVKLTVNDEGGATPSAAAADDVVSSRPISIPEFGQYVSNLHAQSNQPFRDLFQVLDSGETGHSTNYAVDPERKNYNRFGNIVVYDDNRIPLQPLPDHPDCQEDYINACYVDGYSVPQKFIATQGPLPKTVVHFWQLIWQERPPTIVMVTNVKEGNRIKCQQYWPDSGKKDFGPFQVTITDQQVFADYAIRTLSVSLGSGRSHKVTQYHFTAWPDHGVPDYATPILAFHRRVKSQHHPSRGPMVVHCSAGVGRTGTFIVIDHILEQIEKEQVVDIPGAITKIRQKRMKMVQSVEQFTFIHDAILESVTCGDTQIAATNLRVAIGKMSKKDRLSQLNVFQTQFKILEQVSTKPEEVKCNQALTFPKRNRGNDYLPADRWRVILKGEQPDYIHAVNINGYKQQKAFIIAQGPMDSTVRNFWKMIYDRKCAVVVMVSDLVERGTECSVRYWPSSGMYSYGEYTVDLLGEEPLEGFTIRELSVMEGKSGKAHKVTQFHITCWSPDGRCSNLKSITDVIEEMTKVQIRSGNKPIVVHCNDTVTRSGMFCAIATTIERCKTEGVVDVFQVVKALRVQKPGAVPNVDTYKLVFEAALVFLESFDTYANFQNI